MDLTGFTKPKVFINYARQDKDKALKLYKKLKEYGCDPWIDCENLLAGIDFKKAIRQAIRNSDFFIACLSDNSVSKIGFVQTELKEGYAMLQKYPYERIYLIPVRFDDCKVPCELEDYQWVDLFEVHSFNEVLKSIQKEWEKRGHEWPKAEAWNLITSGEKRKSIFNVVEMKVQRLVREGFFDVSRSSQYAKGLLDMLFLNNGHGILIAHDMKRYAKYYFTLNENQLVRRVEELIYETDFTKIFTRSGVAKSDWEYTIHRFNMFGEGIAAGQRYYRLHYDHYEQTWVSSFREK